MSAAKPSYDVRRLFIVVVPTKGGFEIGLADGLHPWKLHATASKRSTANLIATLLATHYEVPCFPCTAEPEPEETCTP